MNVDITSIRIVRSSDTHIRIALKKAEGDYEEHETFFCLDQKSYEALFRYAMLGQLTYDTPLYDDGLYKLHFFPLGIAVTYSGPREQDFFNFPVKEIVPHIDSLFNGDHEEYDLTCLIEDWKEKYGPKVVLNIEYHVRERLEQDEQSEWLHEKVDGGLIDRLTRWAEGYSSGNTIYVNIVFDGQLRYDKPCDYYWWLSSDDVSRIVNGGWIAHAKDYPATEDTKYCYSMHT